MNWASVQNAVADAHGYDGVVSDVPSGARPAARVLVIANARLLLQQAEDRTTGRRWWVAPGGGVDAGETFEAAARREAEEETGLALDVGPHVWSRHHRFDFEGRPHDQYERFFVARVVEEGTATKPDRYVVGSRWWTLAELEASDERFAPRRLPALIRDIFEERYPAPFDCGV